MPKLPLSAGPAAIGRPDVLLERARRAVQNGQPHAAIRIYRDIQRIDPTNIELCNDLGQLYADHGGLDDALTWFDTSLRLDPDQPAAWTRRGIVLGKMGRQEDALAAAERVIALRPDNPTGYINRGLALSALGRFEDAMVVFDTMPPAPAHAAMIANARACAAQWCGRFDEAFRDFDRAAALDSGLESALMNKAMLMMLLGDLPNGQRLYDRHWRRVLRTPAPSFSGQPYLGQSSLKGKTLLLFSEQGFGDTIHFSRYATMAANAGAHVILMVQPPLLSLMTTLPGVAAVIASGGPIPDHDFHCSLLTLPLVFGTTMETIPADVPYLRANPTLVSQWRDRLAGLPGYRIGLVWTGSGGIGDTNAVSRGLRRSIPVEALAPLAAVEGCSFVSLQVGSHTPPREPGLHNFDNELNDFADTAAAMEALDLIISVDTAAAHLAGALGKPVWLLNRFDTDWRWFLKRDDSPWYPSMRIFRQPTPGDWTTVIARVTAATRERFSSRV